MVEARPRKVSVSFRVSSSPKRGGVCGPLFLLTPAPSTVHPAPYTLRPTPYVLPCTLHPAPCAPHPTSCTLHPTPYTQHTTPNTLPPNTLQPTLAVSLVVQNLPHPTTHPVPTSSNTIHPAGLQRQDHTLRPAPYTLHPHSTHYTQHPTLNSLHLTSCTLHSTHYIQHPTPRRPPTPRSRQISGSRRYYLANVPYLEPRGSAVPQYLDWNRI